MTWVRTANLMEQLMAWPLAGAHWEASAEGAPDIPCPLTPWLFSPTDWFIQSLICHRLVNVFLPLGYNPVLFAVRAVAPAWCDTATFPGLLLSPSFLPSFLML